ncbi:unnamed protein product, partial [Amoebophrya sp. A25]
VRNHSARALNGSAFNARGRGAPKSSPGVGFGSSGSAGGGSCVAGLDRSRTASRDAPRESSSSELRDRHQQFLEILGCSCLFDLR